MTDIKIASSSLAKQVYSSIGAKNNNQASSIKEDDEVKRTNVLEKPDATEEGDKASANAKQEEKKVSQAVQERNEKLAKELMNDLNRQNIGLAFSFDDDTEDTIIKVTDLNTEKLVRQIPSEDFLELSKRLKEFQENNKSAVESKEKYAKGLFFDENA
ncbi:MAG: flagellar protein FlaG [Aeromonadales bacterium]|nr:flagellar protein FlaG [Aeromonadales bacterium]